MNSSHRLTVRVKKDKPDIYHGAILRANGVMGSQWVFELFVRGPSYEQLRSYRTAHARGIPCRKPYEAAAATVCAVYALRRCAVAHWKITKSNSSYKVQSYVITFSYTYFTALLSCSLLSSAPSYYRLQELLLISEIIMSSTGSSRSYHRLHKFIYRYSRLGRVDLIKVQLYLAVLILGSDSAKIYPLPN